MFLSSCKSQNTNPEDTIAGYDLADPVVIHLKSDLDEISGLFYYPKDTSVFAINDELGLLFKIYIRDKVKIEKWKFGANGDYEDIVLHDSTFFVLESSGKLVSFQFENNKVVKLNTAYLPVTGKNDFEALYYDSSVNRLVVVCKSCSEDKHHKVSAFAFDPETRSFNHDKFFAINTKPVREKLGKVAFKPSAAAIHPLTHQLYVLSSVAKTLVTADLRGNINGIYSLNPKLFKQPEGLTFTPQGDMLISNEAAGVGAATILYFKYQAVDEKN